MKTRLSGRLRRLLEPNCGCPSTTAKLRNVLRARWVLVIATLTFVPAGAWGLAEPASEPEAECFRKIWESYEQDLWFYDPAGNRVVPEIARDWLVLRFRSAGPSATEAPGSRPPKGEALPDPIQTFNREFEPYFSRYVYDPSAGRDLCAYLVTGGVPVGLVLSEIRRHGVVAYAHPAVRIAQDLYATTDTVDLEWKTGLEPALRQRLLKAVGAEGFAESVPGGQERVSVDVCRSPVWRAANLLAEDLRVIWATPTLIKIVPPVQARISLGIRGAAVGSPIPFQIEIAFSERVEIDPSSVANLNLRPGDLYENLFEVVYERALSSADVAESPIVIDGSLRFYAPGDFELPPVPVYHRHRDAEDQGLHVVHTQPTLVRVSSLVPDGQGGRQLRVPSGPDLSDRQVVETRRRMGRAAILSAVGAAAVIGCAVGLVWLLAKRKPAEEAGAPGEAPGVRESLLGWAEEPPDPVTPAHLAALGKALRAYLAQACEVPAEATGGSAGAFFRRIRGELPASEGERVREVLAALDEAIAKGEIEDAEPRRVFRETANIVRTLELRKS